MQFPRIGQWQTRHFGDFWSQVKADFPGTADAPPVELVSPGVPQIQLLLLPPLRRVIFSSSDQATLLQVQDNRFHFNWRKVNEESSYPRFTLLFPQFKKWLEAYREFLRQKKLGEEKPSRFELTYVNHLDVSGDLSTALEKYVKLFNWSAVSPSFLSAPKSVTSAWQFEMPEGLGTMVANLAHVKTLDNRELLVLALNCFGERVEMAQFDHWFDIAHRSIVFGFTDLTTDTGHKLWGRER